MSDIPEVRIKRRHRIRKFLAWVIIATAFYHWWYVDVPLLVLFMTILWLSRRHEA